MLKTVSHYRRQLGEKGLVRICFGRLVWYHFLLKRAMWVFRNWTLGKFVELSGNTIIIDGVSLSVNNSLIATADKGPMYLGIYESAERELVRQYMDPTLATIEIGGSIGGVACITNRLLSNPHHHVVDECNPLILPTLNFNRDLNACKFSIAPYAIAYGNEVVEFTVSKQFFMMSRLNGGDGKKIYVPAVSLRRLMLKFGFTTINLISDCEGGEVEIVENEADVFRDHVKNLILETHEFERGRAAITNTLSTLVTLGFEITRQQQNVLAMVNRNL